jgi:hypothetical protein
MQNAKDVPNKFGGVSVEIEHLNDQLKFSHNGNPFTLAHLHSLVQQVSSKSSTNDDEAVTGKFGTGFIATHLLSPKITVEGIVELNNEYRDIDMLLDREGDSSEELIKKISFALDRLKETGNQEVFKPCNRVNQMKNEEALLTSFTYKLNTPEARKAATNGIKDIVETLPIALLTNGGKIKQVRVVDESGTVTYRRGNPIVKGSGIKSIEVLITGDNIEGKTPTQMLYAYDSVGEEITLVTEVAVDGHTKLVPIRTTTPMLYRDFPLIGSEKFHFPFIINGKDFNPTEDRNGIVLHAKEDNDAITNRLRIEEAFATAKKFTTSLMEIGIDNRYLLAKTRLPNEKWDNDFSKGWYKNLQEDYRHFLVDLPLVKVSEGGSEYNTLRNAHLPSYGGNNEVKLKFYDLVKPLVGSRKVPLRNDLIDWLDCTGPLEEIESWPVGMRFKLHDLLEELKECETLSALEQKLENTEAINWLRALYSFLIEENEVELFQQFAIVPNCYGLLMKVEENKLYKENLDDPLSDHFLDILRDADPESDWRKILVDRRIKNLPFVTQKKGLSSLSLKLNNKLSDRTDAAAGSRFNLSFFQREDCAQIVGRILRSEKQNATGNSLRSRLYDHVHDLFGWEKEPVITDNLDSFGFTPAIRLLIHLVNNKIQDSIDLSGLAKKLSFTKDETIDWLNKYLQVLQEVEEFRGELETGKIFLNQYQQFDFITNLQDPGTEEYPLPTDLISVLHGLDSNKDWAAELIDSRIKVRRGSAKTFDELGTTLIEVVNSILGQMPKERELTFAEKGESLNTLVEWAENNKDLSTKFLKSFERQSKNLFFDLNFGGGKLRISDMKMLKEDGVVDLLGKIKSSELSTAEVESLIDVVTPETLATVLSQAEDLKAEADHKKAMIAIGETAENAIQIAIQEHVPLAKAGRPFGGRGSFDIRVSNEQNGKYFDIEIKSYAYGGGRSFLFAPDQAKRVIDRTPGFAICLLERKANNLPMHIEYVRENLQTCRVSAQVFQRGYDDYLQHREIEDRPIDPSKLAITILGDARIKVDGNHLKMRGRDFLTLINDIKLYIQ